MVEEEALSTNLSKSSKEETAVGKVMGITTDKSGDKDLDSKGLGPW
jgi:hypothetical protein